MIFDAPLPKRNALRDALDHAYRQDETEVINQLIELAQSPTEAITRIQTHATRFIQGIRDAQAKSSGIESFMYEYDLTSEEGVALMCLAEALLRVPDKATRDQLIKDKVASADWASHMGQSDSFFVNATTWALMLTGKLQKNEKQSRFGGVLKRFFSRSSEPIVRKAVGTAMKILSKQFVLGRTIEEAVQRAKNKEKQGFRYSYDMLGEAARTAEDAEQYFQSYQHAIDIIGAQGFSDDANKNPGISVKLSALHPRYEWAQYDSVMSELVPRLFALCLNAKEKNIGLTIDAEEADRLDLSLDVIEAVFSDSALGNWQGFGVAVQSYQKRAFHVLDWLAELAKKHKRCINVRLIKGAYWDSEIKNSQMLGLDNYPVFTRKSSTDISFQACAKKLLSHRDVLFPRFATHNAYTVALILELVGDDRDFEFQCLHGMGDSLYQQIVPKDALNIPCRIYAPVGQHEDLLPYLVRRLLENGANTSFVNRIADKEALVTDLIEDPVAVIKNKENKPHPKIPLPKNIFSPARKNSNGIDLSHAFELKKLDDDLTQASQKSWQVGPIIHGKELNNNSHEVFSPSNRQCVVGHVSETEPEQIEAALQHGDAAFLNWDNQPVDERAAILEHAAELFEKNRSELIYLAIHESGKTIPDAIAEVREAIDFLYYYAAEARRQMTGPTLLNGYTGEENSLQLSGRGMMLCISPWNFPLAIFTGQLAAALSVGNTVIAKPAEQTPLIAGLAVRLLHAAGVPGDVLQLLPGSGSVVGASCVADPRIKGVLFTGSTETARMINQSLANRPGPIVPFIAETGGQNTMIVDSSALLEQVVDDVITSAFGSAGQRCSACRVLYLQDDIADQAINMLKGAMAELRISDPVLLSTDIGPIIDFDAKNSLEQHAIKMDEQGECLFQTPMHADCERGIFFAPRAYLINSINDLEREVFGPILHVIRFNKKELDQVIDDINNTGYGLTLGIHSRIDANIDYIQTRIRVGNCYVNRNMIGAVVGLQPFGGEGLSGTGPKAGGPHYLQRLCCERTLSVNTTAAGGNATLLSLAE